MDIVALCRFSWVCRSYHAFAKDGGLGRLQALLPSVSPCVPDASRLPPSLETSLVAVLDSILSHIKHSDLVTEPLCDAVSVALPSSPQLILLGNLGSVVSLDKFPFVIGRGFKSNSASVDFYPSMHAFLVYICSC